MNAPSPAHLVLIAAVARNGVIGRDNALPWRLKADLAHFRRHTLGHPVLMGRKTWVSLGRPLPGRRNLVVSRDPAFRAEGAEGFSSPEAALAACHDAASVFVIGGAELYRTLIDQADVLLLTEIDAEIAGDAHFPPFEARHFDRVELGSHPADADNDYPVRFLRYERRPA